MSLFPLGLISQGGGAGGGAAAFELISTTFGNGSANSISLTSIPTTYKHLQIRATLSFAGGGSGVAALMQFNGDTGSNYSSHSFYGNGSSVLTNYGTSTTYMGLGVHPATTDIYGVAICDILDYAETTKNKTIRNLSGSHDGTNYRVELRSSARYSTEAVSSIRIYSASGVAFTSASRISLYGVKGS